MAATAADYGWVAGDPETFGGYCLTLARGLTPAEFLARAGARPGARCTGISALAGLWAETVWDIDSLLIGVTAVPGDGGDWALGAEINGYAGVTPEVIVPLSAGTRLVSHYHASANAASRFCWAEDGVIRLTFEPFSPDHREGSTPDTLVGLMREAGFGAGQDADLWQEIAAAFALAERLTGVRLTMGLLEESRYKCGVARVR